MYGRFFPVPDISIKKMASALLLLSNYVADAQEYHVNAQDNSSSVQSGIIIGACVCALSICLACLKIHCRNNNNQADADGGAYIPPPVAPIPGPPRITIQLGH